MVGAADGVSNRVVGKEQYTAKKTAMQDTEAPDRQAGPLGPFQGGRRRFTGVYRLQRAWSACMRKMDTPEHILYEIRQSQLLL